MSGFVSWKKMVKMTVSKALKEGEKICESKFVAKELLKFHLNLSDEKIILNLSLNLDNQDGYFTLLDRYKSGEPLEYIVGKAEFLEEEFEVEKGVLIPRFETEILVQKTLEVAKEFKNVRICEIGFGSGIISISLKKRLNQADIIATDISQIALKVAQKNAKKHSAKVEFKLSSLLDEVSENFDIIVSNPPYIAKDYKLDKWVLSEPKEALFGGEVGDEILRKIINLAKTRAKFLVCEIGYDQKHSLSQALKEAGFEYEFYQDLAGFDRGFVARNLNLGLFY